MNLRTIPDDPFRTAPPYQAPGEIEPLEPRPPTAREIDLMQVAVEQELMDCLKGGEPFLAFDEYGAASRWDAWELWTVLTDRLDAADTAKTLAAVLEYTGVEAPWVERLKQTIQSTAIDPFVAEQAALRLEFADADVE